MYLSAFLYRDEQAGGLEHDLRSGALAGFGTRKEFCARPPELDAARCVASVAVQQVVIVARLQVVLQAVAAYHQRPHRDLPEESLACRGIVNHPGGGAQCDVKFTQLKRMDTKINSRLEIKKALKANPHNETQAPHCHHKKESYIKW